MTSMLDGRTNFIIYVPTKRPPRKRHMAKSRETLGRLWHNREYRWGVVAQVFYVAAQIMVWTFIIQYADNLGINKAVYPGLLGHVERRENNVAHGVTPVGNQIWKNHKRRYGHARRLPTMSSFHFSAFRSMC